MEFLGAANNNDVADITFLVDRSSSMANYEEQVTSSIREITSSMRGKGKVQIISVGDIPVLEYTGSPDNLDTFSVKALKAPYTDVPTLDQGLRLAVNGLINAEKKRGIIYITGGTSGETSFRHSSLSDLTNYLNNNAVSFCPIYLEQASPSEEIAYIAENTTGSSYYVYRPEGLSSVVSDIINIPSGLYQLRYNSLLQTNYGRKYLPVEVETYLLNHSGKDESGYFAPLE